MPPCVLIDRSALLHNLNFLLGQSPMRAAFPVIKANAYGHGASLVAEILESHFDESEMPLFCVARQREAQALREAGIKRDLLVMSHFDLEQSPPENCIYALSSLEDIKKAVSVNNKKHRFHLHVNTGMNRLGIREENFSAAIQLASESLELEGVYAHFSCAEDDFEQCSQKELQIFSKFLDQFLDSFPVSQIPGMLWLHMENSPSRHKGLELDRRLNAFRPGIHLYGAYADSSCRPESSELSPVARVGAQIRDIYTLQPGEAISYGQRYRCQERKRIAVVPLGYADGISRSLSWDGTGDPPSVGFVVEGEILPILGRVTMDMCLVDVEAHSNPERINANSMAWWLCGEQTAESVAEELKTISYEVFTSLSARLERISQ